MLYVVRHVSYCGSLPPVVLYVARSPTLMLVANQNSDNVTALTVSPETGALTPTGAVSHMKWPVSILPLPRPS